MLGAPIIRCPERRGRSRGRRVPQIGSIGEIAWSTECLWSIIDRTDGLERQFCSATCAALG